MTYEVGAAVKKSVLAIGCGEPLALALSKDWSAASQFELRVVPTAIAAIRELEQRRFDLCVLDSTAAGTPWPAALRTLQNDFPWMGRIMLASSAEKDRFAEGLWLSHCFLPASCDKRTLRSALVRVSELQSLLASPNTRSLMAKIERLPVLGGTERKLMHAVQSPDVSAAEIATILQGDVVLSAKVLQLVNSAYFGLGKKIGSVHQAVSYAGIAVMKSFAMTAQLHALFGAATSAVATQAIHRHSLLVGRVTRQLIGRHPHAELALATGMSHDLGALAIALSGAATGSSSRRQRHRDRDDTRDVSHAALSGLMAHLWGFPDPICEAIALHHEPHRAGRAEFDLLTALHLADAIVYCHVEGTPLADELDMPYLTKLGIAHRIDDYVRSAAELLDGQPASPGARFSGGASRTSLATQ